MIYCEQCGAQARDGARFCAVCGGRLLTDAEIAARKAGGNLPPPVATPALGGLGTGLLVTWLIFSGLAWVGGILTFIALIAAGSYVSHRELEMILSFLVPSGVLSLVSAVFHMVWLHQSWATVPLRPHDMTPGRAVGFLFIPLFNFYWVFRALPGLSGALAQSLRARDPRETTSAGYGAGVTACILTLIPYVNVLAWPLYLAWALLVHGAKRRLLANS